MNNSKLLNILLIAYLFPPLWDPQSIRWYYLSKELAKAGVNIDILTVNYPGEIENIPGINFFRTFPGPFGGIIFKVVANPSVSSAKTRQSKGFLFIKKIYRSLRKFAEYLMLGDLRNEWLPIGYYNALKIMKEKKYDFLITSHEPMVDTFLGLALKNKMKIKWIADIADPVSAYYYPSIWRPILKKIEKAVLKKADAVLVTNESLKKEYEKIAGSANKIFVITQGFDLEFFRSQKRTDKNEKFTLTYTGSFYKEFKDPKSLIKALEKLNFDFELRLAGWLENFLPLFEPIKQKVKYLGVLPHREVLQVQASSDILIYLGYKHDNRVPGKFYEYLGSKKPILCIIQNEEDPVAKIVKTLEVGEVCFNEPKEISQAIEKFYELWVNKKINSVYPYEEDKIKEFSWQNQAQKLIMTIKKL